jgi:hypothetical protein
VPVPDNKMLYLTFLDKNPFYQIVIAITTIKCGATPVITVLKKASQSDRKAAQPVASSAV